MRARLSACAALETGVRAYHTEVLLARGVYNIPSFGWGNVGWPSIDPNGCH